MPRLGTHSNVSGSSPSSSRRRAAGATPTWSSLLLSHRFLNIRNICLFLAGFFVMRNMFRRDYRREEIQYLRNSGMSEEQIHRVVPRTAEEQRKYVQDKANDVERMKKDIAYLLNEVAELKTRSMDQYRPHSDERQRQPESDIEKPDSAEKQQGDSTGGGGDGREDALKTMDQIHKAKRKEQEEDLLRTHPDFHASKRIQDMTEEEIHKALKKRL